MKKTSPGQWRDTGLAIILIFLLLAVFTRNTFYIPAAILVTLLTMTFPKIFCPASILWFGLAHIMGSTVSRIIMTIIYCSIVVPVGLIRRLSGNDPMGFKKWKSGEESVFVKRDHLFSADDLNKPF